MNILGIETSCDETSASVVENGARVLSNVVATSLSHHERYGGVIPEIASRKQLESIHAVVDEAVSSSGCSFKKIKAIAVTESPGLIGSLLVGNSFAKAVSFALKKPLININHVKAHLYANFLKMPDESNPLPKLPAIGLIVSGGHSSIYYMKDYTHYELMGQTRDDAAGEAYDKVARILGLGYPGGPVIDRLAREGRKTLIRFNPSRLPDSFNFSFSGTKTAVLYYHQRHHKDPDYNIADVAYAFQESVISALIEKTLEACLKKSCRTILVGGGVAANSALRQGLRESAEKSGIKTFFPPLTLCMDNAAMVAGYAYHQLKKE